MKTIRFALLLGLAVLLTGCQGSPDVSIENQHISLNPAGAPAATIDAHGNLSIDGETVTVSAPQRQMLARYHDNVVALYAETEALKDIGLNMAGDALQMAGRSIKESIGLAEPASTDAKAQAQAMRAKGEKIEQRAQTLCQRLQRTRELQATLASHIAAFGPYARLDPAPAQLNCL